MRLTTKFSTFMTLLTGLTILVTLLGCSWSFYHSINERGEHRLNRIVALVDNELLAHSPEQLEDRLNDMMIPLEIVRLTLSSGSLVLDYELPAGYLPTRHQARLRHHSVRLVKHPSLVLNLTWRDPVDDYFHSLLTTTPLSLAIAFMVIVLVYGARWVKRQFSGLELLENRATRILNGERGKVVRGTLHEWPPRTSSAMDVLLSELQKAGEQRSRVDTLIRSYAAQDVQTGLSNRLFFENQLAMLLENNEQVGTHGIVMMIRVPDFDILRETWGRSAVDDYLYNLINLLSTFVMRYPGALLARYFHSDFAVLLPHSTLKEADSIASQLLKSVDAMPPTRMLDPQDMVHIGICAWRDGQSVEQVMEHAEAAVRNAVLQGSNSWAVYDDKLPQKGRGNVKWRTMLEDTLRRGGPRLYQKPSVLRNGEVHHREMAGRIFDGETEVLAAEYMPVVQQLGLSEQYDRQMISRMIPLLRFWPDETLAFPVTVESLLRRPFQRWLRDTLMQCEKSIRSRILFELAEADVCQHISRLQPVVRLIKVLGARIAITQAGLTVVSTTYLQELDAEVLKLHPGMVRNIDKRTENQLFVESLVEACKGTRTLVFASGTRTRGEWQTLLEKGVSGAQGEFFVGSRPLDSNVKKYSRRYPV
ncbi:RNase E specificity factor CsrD [Erwinia sp. CPCC 100877]|nr:RNase E specificity factor CsrD [Erwinia sp. CPCC 100877]